MTEYRAGSQIAGYQLESAIGRGGMATVYRARDVRLGRRVALKLLDPVLAGSREFQRRFIRESQLAASLDHPNIVPIFEAGEANAQLFIAMRYVAGGDLKALLDEGEVLLPVTRVLRLFVQIGEALDAAHRLGLVHRDIKPANVLLATGNDQSGHACSEHVYLSDFGLTKRISSDSTALTGTGRFVGTVDYVSPEQIQGAPLGPTADIYALGCVLYQCLTGRVPFHRDDDAALLWAHLVEPPPPVSGTRPDLPSRVNDVVTRAMAKSPADRYASCRDLVRDFEVALEDLVVPQAEPDAPSTRATPRHGPQARASGPAAGAPVPSAEVAESGTAPQLGPAPEVASGQPDLASATAAKAPESQMAAPSERQPAGDSGAQAADSEEDFTPRPAPAKSAGAVVPMHVEPDTKDEGARSAERPRDRSRRRRLLLIAAGATAAVAGVVAGADATLAPPPPPPPGDHQSQPTRVSPAMLTVKVDDTYVGALAVPYPSFDATRATPGAKLRHVVFTGEGCSGRTVFSTESKTPQWRPAAAGKYTWRTDYVFENASPPVLGVCSRPFNAVRAPLALIPRAGSGPAATAVTASAHLLRRGWMRKGDLPAGSVTFTLFFDNRCAYPIDTQTIPVVPDLYPQPGPYQPGGVATSRPFQINHAGTFYWTMRYSGTATFAPTGTACGDNGTMTVMGPATATPFPSTTGSPSGTTPAPPYGGPSPTTNNPRRTTDPPDSYSSSSPTDSQTPTTSPPGASSSSSSTTPTSSGSPSSPQTSLAPTIPTGTSTDAGTPNSPTGTSTTPP